MIHILVIGAGAVGLPLACHLAGENKEVYVIDKNQDLIDKYNKDLSLSVSLGIDKAIYGALWENVGDKLFLSNPGHLPPTKGGGL